MAKRASIATGNFTAAGTWGLIDATMYGQSETSAVVCPTAYSNVARSAQKTPGAVTVSHIGVKLAVRTGTTGTITVHIADATHVEVAGTAVTINCADLPVAATADLNGGWHFFKLATPVALAAATLYEVEAKTSNASQISLFASAATNGLSHAILQAATTGAPAAGDDLFVVGEYTGAGTSNSFVVTMDNTATTDFGSAPTAANGLLGPGVAICNKGTLTYGTTAATNYYLKTSNSVIVYSGGTLNIGTVATAIPRDSTAVLEFDPGADGDYGLLARNLSTVVMQGLSRTSGKDFVSCKLNTDEAANSTSLGVDTDTGWLDNDEIVVASTTRTYTQAEKGTLNGAAGASTLTVDGFAGAGGGVLNAHSGTSPTQAEVILLSRNVVVRSATSSRACFFGVKPTATVDCDWVRFRYLGMATAGKRGIEIETTTGSSSFNYCSNSETSTNGYHYYITGASVNNVTVTNNTCYLSNQTGIILATATTGTAITISNNIVIYTTGTSACISLADVGITCQNNVCVSSFAVGFTLSEANIIGTISGNLIHSCATFGIHVASSIYDSIMSDTTVYRCSSAGLTFATNTNIMLKNFTFDGLTLFGNLNENILFDSATEFGNSIGVKFIDLVSNGDTTFSTVDGIDFGTNLIHADMTMINGDFSTVAGIKTAHTNDLTLGANTCLQLTALTSKLASATEVSTQANLARNGFISSQKHDQTTGLHKTLKKYGTITIEVTTVHTGSQSVKMTPNNASNKLESGSFKVAVANGATLTPTVYVYEDGSYNGARARLILKRNDAIGITADTVIDTATAASDAAWEALTGTTAAASDDGVMEFVVDCDGTAGNLFVDSFTVA